MGLFRESLDSELVVSIVETLLTELTATRDTKRIGMMNDVEAIDTPANIATFATEILEVLSRTARFDLSMQGLSVEERRACNDLLKLLSNSKCCEQKLAVLRL